MSHTGEWTADFLKWFDGIKGIFSTDPAGEIILMIQALTDIIYSSRVPADLITSDGDGLITTDGDQLIAFWTIKTSETCNCLSINNN